MKSKCCSAPIKTENDGGTTVWMICEKCTKACDIEMDPPTQEKYNSK